MKKTGFILALLLSFSLVTLATEKDDLINKYSKTAFKLFKKKKYDEAMVYYDKIIDLKPISDIDSFYAFKAHCFYSMGRYNDAIPYFEKRLEVSPHDFASRVNLAGSYYYLADYEDALEEFRKVDNMRKTAWRNVKSEKDPYFQNPLEENIGVCYASMGETNLAFQYADSLLSVNPENASALLINAKAYFERGEYDESIRYADLYLKKKKDTHFIYGIKAGSLSKLNRYDEALAVLKAGHKTKPNNAYLLTNLAEMYWKIGDNTSALKYYDLSIKKESLYWGNHYAKGNFLSEEGNKDEARTCLEKALELNPRAEKTIRPLLDKL